MKRSFQSGSQKRKKKQQMIIQQLPKVDRYFCVKQGELMSGTASIQQDFISDLPQLQLQAAGSTVSSDNSDSDTLSDNSEIGNAATFSETVDQIVLMKSLDVGEWLDLTEDDVSYWIHKEPADIHHREGPFEKSKRILKTRRGIVQRVYLTSPSVSVASRRITLSQM